MCKDSVNKIEWNDMRKAVPAFITIIMMPLRYHIYIHYLLCLNNIYNKHNNSYSIAYGIIAGLFVSLTLYICDFIFNMLCQCCSNKTS